MAVCHLDGCEAPAKRPASAYERKPVGVFGYEPRASHSQGSKTLFYFCSAKCLLSYLKQIKKL